MLHLANNLFVTHMSHKPTLWADFVGEVQISDSKLRPETNQ